MKKVRKRSLNNLLYNVGYASIGIGFLGMVGVAPAILICGSIDWCINTLLLSEFVIFLGIFFIKKYEVRIKKELYDIKK